jgi:DNA-binding MarR family transcriptional regulator
MSKELSRGHTVQDEPGFLLWKLANLWQRKQREALAPLDLTHVQLALLATLASLVLIEKYVTQVDVARKAGTDEMMTSTVIRTLERNSLLRRLKHPGDSRARALVLTDVGNETLNRGLQIMKQVDREFFGSTSAAFHKLFHQRLTTDGSNNEIDKWK